MQSADWAVLVVVILLIVLAIPHIISASTSVGEIRESMMWNKQRRDMLEAQADRAQVRGA
jgi:competence protein ComGC